MSNKTTVLGLTLVRVVTNSNTDPKIIEKWAVDANRRHLGYVIKVKYWIRPFTLPIIFWYSDCSKTIGWRIITEYKVANCRRDAIRLLAKFNKTEVPYVTPNIGQHNKSNVEIFMR